MNFFRIASRLLKQRYFVGEKELKTSPFIPGFMSVSPWQALQYGPFVYYVDIELRTLSFDEDRLWGLDSQPNHPFFKETPGVFDPRYGEALVNVPIKPALLSGRKLLDAMKKAPDFASQHEVDLRSHIEEYPHIFGDSFKDFIVWYVERVTDFPISEVSLEEAEGVFNDDDCLTDGVRAALESVAHKFRSE
jgi:hypothetical protein